MVRQRKRALNVIGDGFTGGVGKIIQRQNHNVIADADAAVFPSVSKETRVTHDSPLTGFKVMDVDVIPLGDVGHGLSDILTIFDDRLAGADIPQGKFVSEGNRIVNGKADGLVGIHDPARKIVSCRHALNHNNTHGIAVIVDQKIRHFAAQ